MRDPATGRLQHLYLFPTNRITVRYRLKRMVESINKDANDCIFQEELLVALKLFHVRDFISSNKDLFSGRMIDECLMTSCIHCVYMPELEANQDAVLVEKRTDD